MRCAIARNAVTWPAARLWCRAGRADRTVRMMQRLILALLLWIAFGPAAAASLAVVDAQIAAHPGATGAYVLDTGEEALHHADGAVSPPGPAPQACRWPRHRIARDGAAHDPSARSPSAPRQSGWRECRRRDRGGRG